MTRPGPSGGRQVEIDPVETFLHPIPRHDVLRQVRVIAGAEVHHEVAAHSEHGVFVRIGAWLGKISVTSLRQPLACTIKCRCDGCQAWRPQAFRVSPVEPSIGSRKWPATRKSG